MTRDIVLIIILTIILLCFLHIYVTAYSPLSLESADRIINVPEGSSIMTIARILESSGVIRSANMFYLLNRWKGDGTLKSGEYSLNPAMPPLEILSRIKMGNLVQRKVTIPEGLTIFQVAELLDKHGWANKETFLELCSDPNILKAWDIQASSLEGYLFPETYFFTKGISEKQILNVMIKQFWKVFTPDMVERTKELGYNIYQIVTLASLIEKETALPEERPLVSAVFQNRLKERIPLQCDPTVIYGIKEFNGNITKNDLNNKTPYNTYMKEGLPPGPIANPGLGSLMAALYPAQVNYRYFVSKNDGSHVFSETLREHNKAVLKYQIARTEKP
ncbi:endolytic transglycosylase MltG [bacterium]|nr:endolytic transglycosylase MltG [bacterium]